MARKREGGRRGGSVKEWKDLDGNDEDDDDGKGIPEWETDSSPGSLISSLRH